eukprot:g191.t1
MSSTAHPPLPQSTSNIELIYATELETVIKVVLADLGGGCHTPSLELVRSLDRSPAILYEGVAAAATRGGRAQLQQALALDWLPPDAREDLRHRLETRDLTAACADSYTMARRLETLQAYVPEANHGGRGAAPGAAASSTTPKAPHGQASVVGGQPLLPVDGAVPVPQPRATPLRRALGVIFAQTSVAGLARFFHVAADEHDWIAAREHLDVLVTDALAAAASDGPPVASHEMLPLQQHQQQSGTGAGVGAGVGA